MGMTRRIKFTRHPRRWSSPYEQALRVAKTLALS
jgi:hypothetical protein